MEKEKNNIKGVLLDLEGTLINVNQWLPGGRETVEWLLEHNKIQFRIVTNATQRPRAFLHNILKEIACDIPVEWIFTPATSAYFWLKSQKYENGIYLLTHSKLKEDFKDLKLNDKNPNAVLVGDMGDEWNIIKLNNALQHLMDGATLLALETNKFWKGKDGLKIDAGAFVAGLEYSSGKKCAMVFGKPNSIFYSSAVESMGLKLHEVLMLGDDLESDVLGAKACGLRSTLVKTGKSSHLSPKAASQADMCFKTIFDLVEFCQLNMKSAGSKGTLSKRTS